MVLNPKESSRADMAPSQGPELELVADNILVGDASFAKGEIVSYTTLPKKDRKTGETIPGKEKSYTVVGESKNESGGLILKALDSKREFAINAKAVTERVVQTEPDPEPESEPQPEGAPDAPDALLDELPPTQPEPIPEGANVVVDVGNTEIPPQELDTGSPPRKIPEAPEPFPIRVPKIDPSDEGQLLEARATLRNIDSSPEETIKAFDALQGNPDTTTNAPDVKTNAKKLEDTLKTLHAAGIKTKRNGDLKFFSKRKVERAKKEGEPQELLDLIEQYDYLLTAVSLGDGEQIEK
ncbi:hypothetical protein C0581_00555 [Candidatus Parcubacteria bacterium]|nr:MAG: hypothetical protein C0581_00555 [Candidatus Parcubacteria bacterium]